jgi:hypothetical protein
MRRALVIILLLAGASWVWAHRQYYNNTDISVTQSNTAISFTDNGSGGSSAAFRARVVVIRSSAGSANTCYFDLKDTVATTADTALEPGATWSEVFDDPTDVNQQGGWSGMGVICDTGETATFNVTAAR